MSNVLLFIPENSRILRGVFSPDQSLDHVTSNLVPNRQTISLHDFDVVWESGKPSNVFATAVLHLLGVPHQVCGNVVFVDRDRKGLTSEIVERVSEIVRIHENIS